VTPPFPAFLSSTAAGLVGISWSLPHPDEIIRTFFFFFFFSSSSSSDFKESIGWEWRGFVEACG